MRLREPNKNGINRLRKVSRSDYDSITTRNIVQDANEELAYRIRIRTPNVDTMIRQDVHNTIKAMLQDGKSKTDILNLLNEKYANSSIKQYFEKYIEDHERKLIKSKEDEGR